MLSKSKTFTEGFQPNKNFSPNSSLATFTFNQNSHFFNRPKKPIFDNFTSNETVSTFKFDPTSREHLLGHEADIEFSSSNDRVEQYPGSYSEVTQLESSANQPPNHKISESLAQKSKPNPVEFRPLVSNSTSVISSKCSSKFSKPPKKLKKNFLSWLMKNRSESWNEISDEERFLSLASLLVCVFPSKINTSVASKSEAKLALIDSEEEHFLKHRDSLVLANYRQEQMMQELPYPDPLLHQPLGEYHQRPIYARPVSPRPPPYVVPQKPKKPKKLKKKLTRRLSLKVAKSMPTKTSQPQQPQNLTQTQANQKSIVTKKSASAPISRTATSFLSAKHYGTTWIQNFHNQRHLLKNDSEEDDGSSTDNADEGGSDNEDDNDDDQFNYEIDDAEDDGDGDDEDDDDDDGDDTIDSDALDEDNNNNLLNNGAGNEDISDDDGMNDDLASDFSDSYEGWTSMDDHAKYHHNY